MKQSSDYFGPYRLPEGWRWMRLGEISTKPQYGLSQAASPEPIGPKFVRITDITSGQIEWENVPYCRINTRSWEKYRLDEGDLLFARSGSIGATILIKEKPPCDAVFASYLIRIRLDVSVALPEFVDLFLKSSVGQAQLVPQGAAQKNINAKLIQRLLIPLPPLEEQRRIVARIEELMGRVREARRLREEARNEAERLWQAILAQTFPRPGSELPEGWRWAKLGEIATVFSGTWGKDPSSQGSDEEALVRVIRVSDIKETLTIDYASVPWRCVTQKEVKRLALRDGDVIVVKSSGSQAKVISGRAALFRQQPEIFLPSNFVFAVRCNEKEVDPRFLWCWLNSEPVKQAIKQMVATFTYPNLKKSDYVKLPIPLPPLEEQRRIVVHLQEVQEKIKALKEAQEQTEAELKRLEQAILEKAFRGEL